MKKILHLALAVAALFAASPARAWTYQDGDVLLIFRASGFNDVELDLGNVSQFTNLTSGTTITVNNWNLNLVTNTFGTDLTGVSVIVAGATSYTNATAGRIAWLSGSDTSFVPSAVTPSTWQSKLWSIINSIGTRPVIYLVPATNGSAAYSIDPGSSYGLASYDKIVTANGQNAATIAQFGGNADFTVEQVVPGSFNFWQIIPSFASPKPAATLAGAFTITADGALSFTAGSVVPPPAITGITHSGTTNTVSFTTVGSGSYWLVFTNQLGAATTNWPAVSGPVTGDGSSHALSHISTESAGYYRIYRTP